MNRIQFFILTGLSILVLVLLIGNIILVRQTNNEQALFNQAQQTVSLGKASKAMVGEVARSIYQYSQKTQDQGLKDILIRQGINTTGTPGANATESPAPPAAAPASTH